MWRRAWTDHRAAKLAAKRKPKVGDLHQDGSQGQSDHSSAASESNVTGPRSRSQQRGGFRAESKDSQTHWDNPVASPSGEERALYAQ